MAETLTWKSDSPQYTAPNVTWGLRLNERFVWIVKTEDISILPVSFDYESIVDLKNGETMVKRISIGSGYGSLLTGSGGDWKYLKWWVGSEVCIPNIEEFGDYKLAFKRMGREVK